MKKILSSLTVAVALSFAGTLQAGLIWTPETGWRVEGGLAEELLTKEGEPSAIELMNSARAAQEEESWFSALGYYNDVIDLYPESPFAAEAYYQKGVIHLRRHQFERSFEDFSEILDKHPEYPGFGRVIQGGYDVATSIRVGYRPYIWGWIPGFRDDEKALTFYEKIHSAAPYGPHAEMSLFYKGLWARELGKGEDAIDAFERLIYNYPDSVFTPRSYIAIAELYADRVIGPYWDQGSTRDALNYYRDFTALFPKDTYARVAQAKVVELTDTLARNRLELGKFYYYRRNNARAASIFFNEVVNVAPNSEAAEEARSLLVKLRAGEPPPRSFLDWIFGRYPKSDAGDFVDAQTQENLDSMGFRGAAGGEWAEEVE